MKIRKEEAGRKRTLLIGWWLSCSPNKHVKETKSRNESCFTSYTAAFVIAKSQTGRRERKD